MIYWWWLPYTFFWSLIIAAMMAQTGQICSGNGGHRIQVYFDKFTFLKVWVHAMLVLAEVVWCWSLLILSNASDTSRKRPVSPHPHPPLKTTGGGQSITVTNIESKVLANKDIWICINWPSDAILRSFWCRKNIYEGRIIAPEGIP